MTFKIEPNDARERLDALRDQLETLELFMEQAGYRDSAKLTYAARLRISEAIVALPNGGNDAGR